MKLKELLEKRKQPSTTVDVKLGDCLVLEVKRPARKKLWHIQNDAMVQAAAVNSKENPQQYQLALGLATQQLFYPMMQEHVVGWTYKGENDEDVFEFTPENKEELFEALGSAEIGQLVNAYLDSMTSDMRQAEGNDPTSEGDSEKD